MNITITIITKKSLGLLLLAFGTNEAANEEVSNSSQQNDEQTDLCLKNPIIVNTN